MYFRSKCMYATFYNRDTDTTMCLFLEYLDDFVSFRNLSRELAAIGLSMKKFKLKCKGDRYTSS